MEVAKALSEYIVNLKFSDLSADVVEGVKFCFLDWLGVTLSGAKEPLTNILHQMAEDQGRDEGEGVQFAHPHPNPFP